MLNNPLDFHTFRMPNLLCMKIIQAYGMYRMEIWTFFQNCCTKHLNLDFPKMTFELVVLWSILESKLPFHFEIDLPICFAQIITKLFFIWLCQWFSCTSFLDPRQECERQAGSKRILPPVVSAKFRSKKAFSFKFGRVDIRAKVPKGDWLFPRRLYSMYTFWHWSLMLFTFIHFRQKSIWSPRIINIVELAIYLI